MIISIDRIIIIGIDAKKFSLFQQLQKILTVRK